MSLPNYQSKLWHFVIGAEYVQFFDLGVVSFANEWGYDFAFIYHNEDNDYLHYHLIVTTPNRVRMSTMITRLANALCCDITNISCRIPKNFIGAMHYLIHKHNPEKFQYSVDLVVSNYPKDYLQDIYFVQSYIEELTTEQLIEIVLNSKSDIDIMLALGIKRYNQYRFTISDIKKYKTKK